MNKKKKGGPRAECTLGRSLVPFQAFRQQDLQSDESFLIAGIRGLPVDDGVIMTSPNNPEEGTALLKTRGK